MAEAVTHQESDTPPEYAQHLPAGFLWSHTGRSRKHLDWTSGQSFTHSVPHFTAASSQVTPQREPLE